VFAFDERNRYTSVTQGRAQTSYSYNARGERVLKNVNSLSAASRSFAYDESGMLLMEGNANGSAIQEYIWLDNLPVGLLSAGVLPHVNPITSAPHAKSSPPAPTPLSVLRFKLETAVRVRKPPQFISAGWLFCYEYSVLVSGGPRTAACSVASAFINPRGPAGAAA
jgi:YD repeat-containing protein